MKFNQTVRNQPVPPTSSQVPSGPGGVTATPASGAPAPPSTDIVQLLAQSDSQQQKQIIGEQLYRQIYSLHTELAGKITGMQTILTVPLVTLPPSLLHRYVAGDGQL